MLRGCACSAVLQKQEAGNVLQKIKDALPFGVLPIYDVAVDEQTGTAGANLIEQHTAHACLAASTGEVGTTLHRG